MFNRKIRKIKWMMLLITGCAYQFSFSQDSTSIEFKGYLKDLQTFSFTDNADSVFLSNLIHNRINLFLHHGKHFALNIGMRNLVYTGDQVKFTPDFNKLVDQDNGYFDLSYVWINEKALVFVTKFDRLNAEWNFKKGFIRAGRQRINWGINLVWNPNDIFNTYNFLDFDYEERPGTDAARFSYNLTNQSTLEVIAAPSGHDSLWIAAAKYSFNKWGYDFQLIGGNYQNDIVAGIGLAGNIKEAGLKGEVSYFQPRKFFFDTTGVVSISSGIDYGFKNGWYLSGSFLYNAAATDQLLAVNNIISIQLSPKMIMPAKWSFLIQAIRNFTPLLKGNFSITYSPKLRLLILLPYLTYSVAENWDIDLNIQSFFGRNFQNNFKTLGNSIHLRIKWNY